VGKGEGLLDTNIVGLVVGVEVTIDIPVKKNATASPVLFSYDEAMAEVDAETREAEICAACRELVKDSQTTTLILAVRVLGCNVSTVAVDGVVSAYVMFVMSEESMPSANEKADASAEVLSVETPATMVKVTAAFSNADVGCSDNAFEGEEEEG